MYILLTNKQIKNKMLTADKKTVTTKILQILK